MAACLIVWNLYKQTRFLFGVTGAGVVLGAKAPIILTSRAAGAGLTRLLSCALALIFVRNKNQKPKI